MSIYIDPAIPFKRDKQNENENEQQSEVCLCFMQYGWVENTFIRLKIRLFNLPQFF